MKTLHDFYISSAWREFRKQLIFERTQSDGFVHDAMTDEPILQEYDIIAHHKTELTLMNMNDASIALNPDNILLVTHKTHNELHARFGYAQGKKVYIIYGSACAGKNSYVEKVKGNSDLIVDIDNIWQALTGRRYFKPDSLKPIVFNLYNELKQAVKMRTGKWQRAYIIAGLAHKGERERLIDELGAEAILINTDKETCLQRLYNDNERDVEQWTKYINKWFDDYTP